MASNHDAQPVFRRGTVDDADGLLHVIEAAFPQWPPFEIDVPRIDHLRWKMTPPAPLPRDTHAIVELDGTIVATQLRWPTRAHVRGEEVPSEVGGDLAVHPSARGLGLSRLIRAEERARLYPLRLAGYDTRPQNELVRHMQQTDGTRIGRQMNAWVRTFTLRSFIRQHREAGALHLLGATIRGVANSRGGGEASDVPPGARIEKVAAFDERASVLWDRVRREYDLARRRDHDWLNWRYLDRRAGLISAYTLTEGDRLLGYIVGRRSHGAGTVLDLVTDSDVRGAGAALLDHAARALKAAGCDHVTCILPAGHREESALRASHFQRTGAGRTVDFNHQRHEQLPEILEIAADPQAPIHVMLGEFDHA